MIENKLKILSDIYTNASSIIAISDENYNILWSNNLELSNFLNNNNLIEFMALPANFDKTSEITVPASFNKSNYTLNILPIFENDLVEGFIICFVTINDLMKHQINRDYAEIKVEDFANIRTQVSGIISASTLLNDSLQRLELYDELKLLNQQINYCYKILASILNSSEISKYSFGLHNIVKVDASSFLKDILSIIRTLLRSNNVTIDFECNESVFINVDLDRFTALILNLILNSLQYNLEDEKKILISLRTVSDNALLSISDNGIGISDIELENLFGNTKKENMGLLGVSKHNRMWYLVSEYFCNTFKSIMYLSTKENAGTNISYKIPLNSNESIPDYVESKTADYFSNRFSNIYIALSQVTKISYF